jgi:DNA mismatch endonuclease, patch repair protein
MPSQLQSAELPRSSYVADNMTPAQRSKTMSRIRSKNTGIELRIRRMLHARGYRYRVHPAGVPGKPDIAFKSRKVAVFIDGDFWHGWKFDEWAHKLAPYWRGKIERNQARDMENNEILRELGWTVVRLWEHEVKADPDACVAAIETVLRR